VALLLPPSAAVARAPAVGVALALALLPPLAAGVVVVVLAPPVMPPSASLEHPPNQRGMSTAPAGTKHTFNVSRRER
jgi:hypothetical protein